VAVVDDMTARHCESSRLVLRPLARPVHYRASAMSSAERPLSSAGRDMVQLLAQYWEAKRGGKKKPARSRKTSTP
jgi:hypothetical protein